MSNEKERIEPTIAPFQLVGYDQKNATLEIDGEKVVGWSLHDRLRMTRQDGGDAVVAVRVQVTSPIVPKLRQRLGHKMHLSHQYARLAENQKDYSDHVGFEVDAVLNSFSIEISNGVPEVVFYFMTPENKKVRK